MMLPLLGQFTPVLTTASKTILVEALSRLTRLRHLELGMNADHFLIRNLASILPDLESFVHVDQAYLDPRDHPLGPPHPTLKILTFNQVAITAEKLRALVVAFPALQRLSFTGRKDGSNDGKGDSCKDDSMLQEVLGHRCRMSLAIGEQPHIAFLRSRISFPRVKQLDGGLSIHEPSELRQLLWALPSLTNFVGTHKVKNQDCVSEEEIDQEDSIHPIRHLTIDTTTILGKNLRHSLTRMPHLVQLSVLSLVNSETFVEMTRTWRNLQSVRFDLSVECSHAMNWVLIGYPRLKECLGKGHLIGVNDIVSGPEWTCVDIEKLDIEIICVPRLTVEQESLLGDLSWFMGLDDELLALKLRKESYAIQTMVYQRLARLQNLRRVDFEGSQGSKKCREDTLELSLASGFDELVSLRRLEWMGFGGLNHRIGKAERGWVRANWSMVAFPYGLWSPDLEAYVPE